MAKGTRTMTEEIALSSIVFTLELKGDPDEATEGRMGIRSACVLDILIRLRKGKYNDGNQVNLYKLVWLAKFKVPTPPIERGRNK